MTANDRALVVIPARYGSSRFPGKALADLAGAPLVVRTAQAAARITAADTVVVATDDARIRDAVAAAGLPCEMTGEWATGTDRVGEVARRHGHGIVVNLQGDEPLLDPAEIDRLIGALRADPALDLVTFGHRFADEEEWRDPNRVKVVCAGDGTALYFSRAAIPGTFPGAVGAGWRAALRHVGIYGFRRAALERFLALERTPLEKAEGLEQLRALENGLRIRVLATGHEPVGVDTPQDLATVRALWRDRDGTRQP
jgi:3-deoxy-manno-octulosonate cytidylyltransferase (CMP-KDO synthetase)